MEARIMKICIIGAGSPYTPELIERLATMTEELPVTEIAMMDLDEKRLEIMQNFCIRYAANLGFKVKITKTTDRKKAINGSSFVNTQIRVGGNAVRIIDERIPLSMGFVGQETTGAGGFSKALRTIPAMLAIANDVAKLSPDAWIINYTNPTGLVAEAIELHSKAKIAGLCSGGVMAAACTAEAIGCKPEDVRYEYAGLNHMNFSYNITVKGVPLTAEQFECVAEQFTEVDKDLILALNALPSGYLQYYFHTKKRIRKMKKRTRGEAVMLLEQDLYRDFADPAVNTKPESLKKRGGGGYANVAMNVMNALHNNKDSIAVVNTANRGVLSFLPDKAVIEVPCIVNASGITPLVQSTPPNAVWGLIAAVKNYESLTVEAAVSGCRTTALLALLAHPLTGDADEARILLDKILEAHKEYLPAFWN